MRKVILLLIIMSIAIFVSADIIGEGLSGDELLQYVVDNYKTTTTLGYNVARDIMYGEIDLQEGNLLSGVYSGFTIELDMDADPSTDAYYKGINCEHTWPQSMGAGDEPQKSDMHHLFPCKDNVNSSRGNSPFGEIDDPDTDKWYYLSDWITTIPTEHIDQYAEKKNTGTDKFEPREEHKGDAARASFYFYAIYQDDANNIFFTAQKDDLLLWNIYDEVSETELTRTNTIAEYQDYPNPFVLDNTLAQRIWFPELYIKQKLVFDKNEIIFENAEDYSNGKTISFTNCFTETIDIIDISFENDAELYFEIDLDEFPISVERLSTMEISISAISNTRDIVSDLLNITTENHVYQIPISFDTDYFVENDDEELYLSSLEISSYPNPFIISKSKNVGQIIIQTNFNADRGEQAEVEIYNVKGQKIRTLILNSQKDNYSSVSWDAKNDENRLVRTGVYLYRLKVNDKFMANNKMFVLK